MEKQMTLKEFADALRLSTRTIRRYIKAGQVKVTMGGGKGKPFRIPASQIKATLRRVGE